MGEDQIPWRVRKKKIFRPPSKMKMQAHATFGPQFENMPSPEAHLGKNTSRWSWVEGVGVAGRPWAQAALHVGPPEKEARHPGPPPSPGIQLP